MKYLWAALAFLGMTGNGQPGPNNNSEDDKNRLKYPSLDPKLVHISGSGTPSIEPRDLVRHKKVQELIEEGARRGLDDNSINGENSDIP